MKLNDWNKSLQKELDTDDMQDEALLKFFGPAAFVHRTEKGKNELQLAGVDREIILPTGSFRIDCKTRMKEYGDDFFNEHEILLEYKSSIESDTPGWVEKNLLCDYVCYLIEPARTAYLINWKSLQSVWQRRKKDFMYDYGFQIAQNDGYRSKNVAVPVERLESAGVIIRKVRI